MSNSQKYLIVIAGPTAVGKTTAAIAVAKAFETEIISADSRQLYKQMNIGTAKPTDEELAAVPHHFINSHSISEHYNAAGYASDALQVIQNLLKKRKCVIICGGSGMYIKAVCDGFDEIPEIDPAIRQGIVEGYEKFGLVWLQNRMQEVDPDYFISIDKQNTQRLMRALEVKEGTGNSIRFYQQQKKRDHDFKIVKIGLTLPRAILNERIDARMDKMIAEGLFDEAKDLYPFRAHNALQTVGYQEIFNYMDGHYDREEAVRLLKRNSSRYAKRQMTWFQRDQEFVWFGPEALDAIIEFIHQQTKE